MNQKENNGIKYPKEEYSRIDFSYYDEDVSNHTQKLVKCAKEHVCHICESTINAKDNAVRETAIIPYEGFKSCYTCISCCDKILDEFNYSEYDDDEEE